MATVLSTVEAAQLNTLRGELKQWEKSFSDANGGKKAGRQDIKQDPEIGTYLILLRKIDSNEYSCKIQNLRPTPRS